MSAMEFGVRKFDFECGPGATGASKSGGEE